MQNSTISPWLALCFGHLESVIEQLDQEQQSETAWPQMPATASKTDAFAAMISKHLLGQGEQMALVLALAARMNPRILDKLCQPEYLRMTGGTLSSRHSFMPTGQTWLWFMYGNQSTGLPQLRAYFSDEHLFYRENLLRLGSVPEGEAEWFGHLLPSEELMDLVTFGEIRPPAYSSNFPAERISSKLEWEEVILAESTRNSLQELLAWLSHGEQYMSHEDVRRKQRQGYRCLFFGPSGTGKSLTAAQIGKMSGKPVYRIDLSMITSKYIGETEKNLKRIFDRAENRDWILFFDEADALFGKRTQVQDAHDRYANQEVSFLLQRIEDFNGLVILASNLRDNMDEAFTRRFQSMVYFPMPKPAERLRLWNQAFTPGLQPSDGINLNELANRYELSGGAIMNISRYASLMTLRKEQQAIQVADLTEGIRRELEKEGRIM